MDREGAKGRGSKKGEEVKRERRVNGKHERTCTERREKEGGLSECMEGERKEGRGGKGEEKRCFILERRVSGKEREGGRMREAGTWKGGGT